MVKECSNCLYREPHPFGLSFIDSECSGCFTHKEKDVLNWNGRLEQLKEIIERHKQSNKSSYDCIVPVVGDAEDYFVLHNVINVLGLKPLVVCVNDYFYNDIGWQNLHNLITVFDVDSMIYNPDMHLYKEMIRTTLRRHDHILWPAIALRTSYPVHVAVSRKIPLIIWGQHQAIEQVGKFSHVDSVTMSDWSRQQHDLMDITLQQQVGNGAQVNTKHLNYYRYPDIKKVSQKKVTGIYLSNYIRWDPLSQNQSMLKYGFCPEYQSATYDPYEKAGSSVYYHIHDLLKQKRVGYRKIMDHLSRDIRHGYLERKQAKLLYNKFSEQPIDVKPFFTWLGMTKSGQQWFIKHKLQSVAHLLNGEQSEAYVLPSRLTKHISMGCHSEKSYISFGKGI
ncbi:N-acetyl sugar amidotransferase [Alteromonas macleodii]|uniref:N-acetyl sugar amidotransferase n=1 Tax=Alteromonas macleodii TaxID=28108 RepID=UPI00066C486A|nr:N-acetyl sugar amidotransferase [Alteromonas macleodii]CAI3940783.1 N-acetyl sugar amidotransferase [Alteromonas macleodii]VTP51037.1 N-acetyl sugar amidotransferase [Alteromonas macleodii]